MANDNASIAGAWVLDLSRSGTFEEYLRCLGTPEVAIAHQLAGEQAYQSRNVIALDESRLVVHKDTAVNCYTERFLLDQEQVSRTRSGEGLKQAMASLGNDNSLDGYVVVTTTNMPVGRQNLETVEARQLIDGGRAHIQKINVRKVETGEHVVVMRTWVRVPMTQDDHMRLHA
ncbi:unnamed protein product [Pylaiella littoralis]